MILVGNGKLVTRNAAGDYYEDGCVRIDGGVIAEVGQTGVLRRNYPRAEFIDARGGLIMPGLINAHNHIYSAFARGLTIKGHNPKGFLDILKGLWWNLDSHMTLEDVEYSAWWTLIDGIKNGVTTVFDHHASYGAVEGSLFAISDVAAKLGLRACLCYEVSDREGEDKMRAAVHENEAFIKAGVPSQRGMMGLHASFTLSDKTLEYCAARTPGEAGFHIHVAEGLDDVFDALQNHGKRPVHRLHDMGVLGPHTIAGHCIHVNPQEIELLAATDTMVVHNPESNMGNAVGCPPTLEIMKKGVLTGLGTDGYTNDMLESMKVANLLHKHNTMDPNAAWAEPPQMLFYNNGAMVSRLFGERAGVIEPGAAADVIIAEYTPQTPMGGDNVNSHVLFGLNGRCVTTTIAGGRVLMKERALLCADEEALMAKARERAHALAQRINA